MTMNLHTQTTAPVAAQATSVSPLEPSGSSKTKGCKDKIRTKTDVYQTVTNSIIEALERGVKPWVCPWKHNSAVSGIPSNFSTGKAYTGINIMLLWCSAAKHGFQDPRWLTYHQATEQGARVRKGETGTTGIFYKTLEKENDAGELERIPMLKTFTVFNIEQTDGLNLDDEISPQAVTGFDPLPEAEAFFSALARILTNAANGRIISLQQMKSGYLNAICSQMPRTFTRLDCMNWFTGRAQQAALTARRGANLVQRAMRLKN